jgi:hypothetical protein
MIDTPGDQTKFFHSATDNMVKYAQTYFGEKYVFFSESKVRSTFSRKTYWTTKEGPFKSSLNFNWIKVMHITFYQYDKYNYQ